IKNSAGESGWARPRVMSLSWPRSDHEVWIGQRLALLALGKGPAVASAGEHTFHLVQPLQDLIQPYRNHVRQDVVIQVGTSVFGARMPPLDWLAGNVHARHLAAYVLRHDWVGSYSCVPSDRDRAQNLRPRPVHDVTLHGGVALATLQTEAAQRHV